MSDRASRTIAEMKKLALPLMLAIGCGLVSFDVEQPIPEQTVQGSPLGTLLPAGLFSFPLDIDLEASTKAQGTGPAQSAELKAISLAITAPAGETFDFLDTLTIKVSASGQPEREVARLGNVPPQANISLEVVPGVDLLPYIKAGSTLKAEASGSMPRQTVRFNGKVVVRVKV